MNEERKQYSVISTVTIGTDEYRDLIESVAEERIKYEKKNDEWYKYYLRVNELEKKVEELSKKCDRYKEFVESERDKYELWVIRTKGEFAE